MHYPQPQALGWAKGLGGRHGTCTRQHRAHLMQVSAVRTCMRGDAWQLQSMGLSQCMGGWPLGCQALLLL